jgi:hypothetical protein
MRNALAIALVLAGLTAAAPAFNDPCHTDSNRLFWIVGAGFLLGFSALAFARRPTLPPVAAWAIGVSTTVAAIFAIGLLSAMWWAASGCPT